MSIYSIPFDIRSNKFDEKFPEFLQDYGIDPHHYKFTIRECNRIMGGLQKIQSTTTKYSLLAIVSIIPVFVLFIPIVIFFHGLAGYLIVLSLIYILAAISILIMLLFKTIRDVHMNVKTELLNFIEEQNESLYLSKQLQLLLTVFGPNYTANSNEKMNEKTRKEAPNIEIFAIDVAANSNSSYLPSNSRTDIP
jgi:hypothetical protein